LGGCSNKKETVKEDLTAFLNAELETWRAEDYTIEGIHANDISVEVSSIIDDPRYKGCYIATLDFNITTEETVDPDIFWLTDKLSSLYSDSAAKRFRDAYDHDVDIYGADHLDSFFYNHVNVTLNGVLVRSSKQQGDWAEEYFEEFVAEYGDDGVSQKATIKTGLASKGEAIVPNPVRLKPFRTFTEVDQPESAFVFRMKNDNYSGITCGIFEADGGAWKREAMESVKAYLKEELKDVAGYVIIS
jgi:hypothetical protein